MEAQREQRIWSSRSAGSVTHCQCQCQWSWFHRVRQVAAGHGQQGPQAQEVPCWLPAADRLCSTGTATGLPRPGSGSGSVNALAATTRQAHSGQSHTARNSVAPTGWHCQSARPLGQLSSGFRHGHGLALAALAWQRRPLCHFETMPVERPARPLESGAMWQWSFSLGSVKPGLAALSGLGCGPAPARPPVSSSLA